LALLTDDFTGTNGDPWDSGKWTTYLDSGSIQDIQSNAGRQVTDGGYLDYCLAVATPAAVQDAEVLLSIDPNTANTGEQNEIVVLRGSGDESTNGEPTDGYELFCETRANAHGVALYRRIADSRSASLATTTSRSSNGVKFWVRMQVEDSGSDVIIRTKSWDDGAGEPGTWDIEYTDSSPGILLGATGTLHLVAQAGASEVVDNRIDDVTYSTLGTVETVIRPIADTAGTGWDTAPTASQSLYAQVDEETASDTDYIYATDPNP